MGLLQFKDGNSFASGVLTYTYRPINPQETSNRIIIIPIEIGNGIKIEAVIDTGAPYVILDPNLAPLAGFTPELVLSEEIMLIREVKLSGKIARLGFSLRADEGDDMDIEATVFVPDSAEQWNNFPPFLGQAGFLERIRFAIDPTQDKFYFGTL
jgi:predicted aspartyl protease